MSGATTSPAPAGGRPAPLAVASRPLRALVATLLLLAAIGTSFTIARGLHGTAYVLLFGAISVVYLVVGLVVVERRPGTRVGRAILGFGAYMTIYLAADAYIRLPGPPAGAAVLAWSVSISDGPFFLLVAIIFLNFPTDRLPSPRWRVVVGLSAVQAAWLATGAWFRPGPFPFYPELDNPYGIAGFPTTATYEAAYMVQVGLVAISALSLAGRWRRGGPVERAQLKWAAGAAAVIAFAMMSYGILSGPNTYSDAGDMAVGIGLGLFPIAIGIAILRYRLYEIDRLISRTISYAILSAILVATFALVVVGLQAVLAPVTGGGTLAVAASTLAVFALFSPIRGRVQRATDRRFNRSRVDAERVAAAFASRLRDEVDLPTVSGDLVAVVGTALNPSVVGLWLRGGGTAP